MKLKTIAIATMGMMTCLLVAQQTIAATATVTVPAKASGRFGNPGNGEPLIPAIKVSGKGTITISYASGTISDSAVFNVGPKGATYAIGRSYQTPLQEAVGTAFGIVRNHWALIGAFIPDSIVKSPGFSALDGAKNLTTIGIAPNTLFFIGEYTAIDVNGPGTLFLGINDPGADDNIGGFTVKVVGP